MKKFWKTLITIAGAVLGPGMVLLIHNIIKPYLSTDLAATVPQWAQTVIFIGSAVIFGLVFFFLSEPIMNSIKRFSKWFENRTNDQPARVTLAGLAGLLLGLIIAFLITQIIKDINIIWIRIPLSIFIYIACGYIFMRLVTVCGKKLFVKKYGDSISAVTNILDTSAIIDGRIYDICKTGIVEGKLVIPVFVLDELRHIADSSDALKRSKGRRGLDILDNLRKERISTIEISSKNYDDISEVDAKLLKLAEDENGRIITNDFNLNKVAAVRKVKVLNINDLANAVKPLLAAGEKLEVNVIKEGKDPSQGIGYLDDGTMIVVENGRALIGQTVITEVTSVLQTSAGRLIFVKPV